MINLIFPTQILVLTLVLVPVMALVFIDVSSEFLNLWVKKKSSEYLTRACEVSSHEKVQRGGLQQFTLSQSERYSKVYHWHQG